MNKSLLVLLSLIFLSCNGQETSKSKETKKQSINHTNDWKRDEYGCLKLRNKKLADSLIKKHNLEQETVEKFEQVFGQPNDTKVVNTQNVLIYYFDCICKENTIVKNSDKCYAEFYFKNNKLIDKIFLCE
jgi:hypothetical protein